MTPMPLQLRQRNALVAEKVMGQRVVTTQEECTHATGSSYWDCGMECYVVDCDWVVPADAPDDASPDIDDVLPDYCAEIADAWKVVEKMRADGWVCEIFGNDSANPDGYSVTIWRHDTSGSYTQRGPAPLAICLAALAAVGAA